MIIKSQVVFLILSVTIALTNISFAQKQGQGRIDSLLSELPNALPDTNKVNLFAALSYSYFPIDPDIGIKYGNEGLALAEKLKWKNGIALVYGHLGINYAVKSDNTTALEYFLKGLKYFEELGLKSNTATALGNIANVYMSESNYPKALEFHMKALRINEEVDNKKGIATNLSNIGLIYKNQSSYPEALKYFNQSLEINKELGNKKNMANNLAGIGMVYFLQKNHKDALKFYNNANILYEELGIKDGIANSLSYIGTIYCEQADYTKALDYIFKSLNLYKELKNKIGTSDAMNGISVIFLSVAKSDTDHYLLNKHFSGDKTKALQQAKLYSDSAIAIQTEINYLKSLNQSYKNLSEIHDLLGDSKKALESYKNYSTIADSVFNMEKDKKLIQTSMQYEFDKKEAANKVEQEKKDIRQRNVRNSIIAGLAGTLVFLVVVYRQRNNISKEKRRSDELLLNILPEEVAEELKEKGAANAKQFDEVTVMFTDFKNFTRISEKLSPEELVSAIHTCFKAFDEIIGKHNIEKIKTIGDAYMCAGGLPVANNTHAVDVVKAALEIQEYMNTPRTSDVLSDGQVSPSGRFRGAVRIGIHTGPVVAGIVGVKKFAYDIWGDTVNIASRMESSGEARKINISGSTFELVKGKFKCVHRGKIQAKNKGEIDMYFVENNL